MARKGRLPTIGPKDVHAVQLSPRLRKIERRRTRAAARREAAPVIASDKAAIKEAGKEYGVQKRSIEGATDIANESLAQALGSLGGSGLKGKYLGQTKSELLARLQGVGAAVPSLLAEAGEDRTKAVSSARQELRTDRASRESSAISDFDQRLKELRDKGSTALKEREEDSQNGGRSKSEVRSLESAAIAVKNFIGDWQNEPELRKLYPLKTEADWAKAVPFIVHINESANPADVATILKRVRERWHGVSVPYAPSPKGVAAEKRAAG